MHLQLVLLHPLHRREPSLVHVPPDAPLHLLGQAPALHQGLDGVHGLLEVLPLRVQRLQKRNHLADHVCPYVGHDEHAGGADGVLHGILRRDVAVAHRRQGHRRPVHGHHVDTNGGLRSAWTAAVALGLDEGGEPGLLVGPVGDLAGGDAALDDYPEAGDPVDCHRRDEDELAQVHDKEGEAEPLVPLEEKVLEAHQLCQPHEPHQPQEHQGLAPPHGLGGEDVL
mmetsp:Transcript_124551/g.387815  ORF Transcript_124551/g.387815 Transcript_124551/m.387815 type:complete len:225 (-) Transcript_124551:588-1262(-)